VVTTNRSWVRRFVLELNRGTPYCSLGPNSASLRVPSFEPNPTGKPDRGSSGAPASNCSRTNLRPHLRFFISTVRVIASLLTFCLSGVARVLAALVHIAWRLVARVIASLYTLLDGSCDRFALHVASRLVSLVFSLRSTRCLAAGSCDRFAPHVAWGWVSWLLGLWWGWCGCR
jgi:hypothetical protein